MGLGPKEETGPKFWSLAEEVVECGRVLRHLYRPALDLGGVAALWRRVLHGVRELADVDAAGWLRGACASVWLCALAGRAASAEVAEGSPWHAERLSRLVGGTGSLSQLPSLGVDASHFWQNLLSEGLNGKEVQDSVLELVFLAWQCCLRGESREASLSLSREVILERLRAGFGSRCSARASLQGSLEGLPDLAGLGDVVDFWRRLVRDMHALGAADVTACVAARACAEVWARALAGTMDRSDVVVAEIMQGREAPSQLRLPNEADALFYRRWFQDVPSRPAEKALVHVLLLEALTGVLATG